MNGEEIVQPLIFLELFLNFQRLSSAFEFFHFGLGIKRLIAE